MSIWWQQQLRRRPWWMNGLMFVCFYYVFIYIPWDLFIKPVSIDREVFLGVMFSGRGAKLVELLHWVIYAFAAYGFWRMRPWMWPWASVYVAQMAFSSFAWGIVHRGGLSGWIGAFVAGVPCIVVAWALWQERDRFRPQRRSLRERYGDWALVTGASAGIGAEFARALARDGVSCVLTARREDRLRALAAELEQAHKVQTRVVAIDLGVAGAAEKLAGEVADIDVAILINNAGFGWAGNFRRQEADRLRSMVELNCVAPVVLTNRLLPAMLERGKGAVIITGSIAGAQPVPFNTVYSATKAFDRNLGEGLWSEVLGTGVDVLVLEPGPTETEFQAVARETPHPGEPPEKVVAAALDALGRQPAVVSGWVNWIQSTLVRMMPRSLAALLAGRVMSQWVEPETR
jgi:short-subunit dehydrogenase